MKGKRLHYTAEELAWIEGNRHLIRRDLHAAFCERFKRADISFENLRALCKRKKWLTGRDGRIQPGSVSWNTGKKMPHHPNSAKTQFKKGNLPHNTKFLGHERVSKDGYAEISVHEENPHTGYERRYVLKHRYLWEKENGPVPDGMILKSRDCNRLNTDPSNWKLIPRGALPFMNGHRGPDYDSAAPEVKPVIMTLAQLKHARSAKAKAGRNGHRVKDYLQ